MFSFTEDSLIPPTIVNDNAEPLVAYIGSNFTYECRVLKPDLQHRIIYFAWMRYQGLDNNNNLVIAGIEQGSVLTLYNVTKKDEGQYVCLITNRVERDYKIFNLTVTNRPVPGRLPFHAFVRMLCAFKCLFFVANRY